MNKIDLVRQIGDLVCTECTDDRQCGLEFNLCPGIVEAVELVDAYDAEQNAKSKKGVSSNDKR